LRLGAAQAPFAYDYWIQSIEHNPALGCRVAEILEDWRWRPEFLIVLHAPAGAARDLIQATIASVRDQFYPNWVLFVTAAQPAVIETTGPSDSRLISDPTPIINSAQALEAGIATTTADFVVPLLAGHLLSPGALFRFAEALQESRASIIYGDQDEIDASGRRVRPWFKPQWDDEMFLAQDYLSEACAIEMRIVRSVLPITETCDEAATYSLLLAATRAAPGSILHVPYILCHVKAGTKRSNQAARVVAVNRHLRPIGATAVPGPFDTVKTKWPLPDVVPGVSIIIPTRDKVELLRACVDSVLESTSYSNFELIVVDNGSTERETLAYLSRISGQPNVRVISYDFPYNYSALNNFAAKYASHPYLCLLNNDTEVIAREWLTEMMRYAVRADVGAVGAKLLYDDGSIQHAGVIIGICEAAGHAHRFERANGPGYFAQPHLAHIVSAVTAACLVVEKSKFEAVGGLDAENLAVAYNDVDLCLKLEQAGWRNIYVPHAVLLHHESKSRGQDISPKHIDRYMRELTVLQERWGTKTIQDPRLNPNLDRYSETFILRL
jgi:O-antigen biosynthesis protein